MQQIDNSNHNSLSFYNIVQSINLCSQRLYEKDILDDDFLQIRLGTYTTTPSYEIKDPFEKLELRYEEADDELSELYQEYAKVENIPLVVNAKLNLGIIGNRYIISKQMKNILLQLVYFHSYLDLQIIVISDSTYIKDYEYAFSTKHFKDLESGSKVFIDDATSRDRYLSYFTQVLRQRDSY